jgi:hypothetical protein
MPQGPGSLNLNHGLREVDKSTKGSLIKNVLLDGSGKMHAEKIALTMLPM